MRVEGDYTCEICGESFETNVEIAGHTRGHQISISKEESLDAIRKLAEKKGRTPTSTEMDEEGECSTTPIRKHFRCWTSAVEAAGLKPNVRKSVTKNSIRGEILRLAGETNGTPTTREMRRDGNVSVRTVRNHFGSWNEALRSTGLDPNLQLDASRGDVVKAIRQLAENLGRTPSSMEMDASGEFSTAVAQRLFGSWNRALRAAGFEPRMRRNISEPILLGEIDRVVEKLGYVPSSNEFEKHSRFSLGPYWRNFGNWEDSVEAAGHEPRRSIETTKPSNLYYGPNWPRQRSRALERDNHCCQTPGCDFTTQSHLERFGCDLSVHHIVPIRAYVDEEGVLDYKQANTLDNLVTVCQSHHRLWEQISPLRLDLRPK
ncbi:homing endonuclease associated repeat-containing protein [Haloferax sp. Atlit-4N]|uniref:homing endonuclease associated repeat-containing protein n=2 Tax=Haloferacaceae TaxID=1644056 RepID=UPI0034E07802